MLAFFIAVGTLCLICGTLAALLLVADRYLNNYGTCTLRINNGDRQLSVAGGSSVLSSLAAEGIFIPSACGGRGSCGLCKLAITAGAGPLLPTEEPHLSAAEKANHVRLCCQVKVRNDMDLLIPEELFAIKEYRAQVEAIEPLTHDIRFVRLQLQEPDSIKFVPGQYIQLQTPPYALSSEPVYRAYSLATDPQDPTHVELIIRLVPNGICTTWVFEHLKPNHTVTLNGPYGEFHLNDNSNAELIFIAGGSGMAPFRSILYHMMQTNNQRRCRYFFGAVTARDMFYIDEMRQFETQLADFKFIPALSNPAPEDNWTGETGLITQVVGNHYQDCADKEAYLCGSPGMIDACIRVLTERGMPADHVFYDKFA